MTQQSDHAEGSHSSLKSIIGTMPKGQPHTKKDPRPEQPVDLKDILGEMPVGVPFKSSS